MSKRNVFRAALGCTALAVLGCSGESPTGLNQSPETPAANSLQTHLTPGDRTPNGTSLRVRVGGDEDGPDADDDGNGGSNGTRRRLSGYLVVAGRR
ncbi:MAG TPA: hypothetical protein VH277_13695 [Gemmatimonadaceae bacterium]|jgi:hypothetical protein|nr:hypothetical protein [Gemmatimonadaceae bacterium]